MSPAFAAHGLPIGLASDLAAPRECGQPMPTPDGATRCSANGPTPPPAGPVGLSILASSINIISALSLSLSLNHSLALTPARQRPRPGVSTSSGLPRPHALAPLPPDSLSAIPDKYPCSQSSLLWDFEDLRSSGLWRPRRPSASNRVELEQDLAHYRYHCNVPRLPTLT